MEEAITFQEFEDLYKAQDYRFVCLMNSDGSFLVKNNQPKDPSSVRMKQIGTRLKSKALPDGYYTIEGRNSLSKNVVPDRYTIIKGKPSDLQGAPRPININHNSTGQAIKEYTFDEALEMESKVKNLEIDNANLESHNEYLRELLRDLQEDFDRAGEREMQNLEDSGKSNGMQWVENLATNLAPLADRFFDSYDKRMDLQAVRMQMQANGGQLPNNQQQPQRRTYKDLTPEEREQIEPEQLAAMRDAYIEWAEEHNPVEFENIMENGLD